MCIKGNKRRNCRLREKLSFLQKPGGVRGEGREHTPVCKINFGFAGWIPRVKKRCTNIILFRCQRERAGTFDSILDIVARKKHSPGNRRRGGIPKAGSHTRAPLVSHMSKLGESGRSLRPMARRTSGVARSLERGKSDYPASEICL